MTPLSLLAGRTVRLIDYLFYFSVTEASSSEPASANVQIDSDEDPDQMSIYEQKVDKRKKNSLANTPQGKCLNFTRLVEVRDLE